MDKSYFTAEIEACSDMMYRVAWSILRNNADVQDALQDAVLKAWEKRDKLREEKLFRTWITRILINACYDTLNEGFANLDTWPQIPYTQMVSADQIPETIHLVFPDANGNETMLVLQLKK